MNESRYNPGDVFRDREKAKVDTRKARFASLNAYVTKRQGWLTSVPGDRVVTMDCLPDSTLPDALRGLGYDVVADGEGERILPAGITERFVTEGSTVMQVRHHAGITRVRKFAFDL